LRKFSVFFVALFALAMLFQAGSVFAASRLDDTVSDLKGIDYDYGGTTTDGFDCSGFTGYVFKQFGIKLPRSSRDQSTVGDRVAKDDLRPGDLVFFNTMGNGVSHVGIYVGNNNFAHASSSRGVTISSLDESYYAKRYVTARRIMSDVIFHKVTSEQDA
jgi:cell wall-associated NlpC family hydrolase